MKLITFHDRPVSVSYKNALCSMASLFYIAITIVAVLIPFYLVILLIPRVWLESVLIWEQPSVQFKYQYNLVATRTDGQLVACSSFPYQRSLIEDAKGRNTSKGCSSIKVSSIKFFYYWIKLNIQNSRCLKRTGTTMEGSMKSNSLFKQLARWRRCLCSYSLTWSWR